MIFGQIPITRNETLTPNGQKIRIQTFRIGSNGNLQLFCGSELVTQICTVRKIGAGMQIFSIYDSQNNSHERRKQNRHILDYSVHLRVLYLMANRRKSETEL